MPKLRLGSEVALSPQPHDPTGPRQFLTSYHRSWFVVRLSLSSENAVKAPGATAAAALSRNELQENAIVPSE